VLPQTEKLPDTLSVPLVPSDWKDLFWQVPVYGSLRDDATKEKIGYARVVKKFI